MATPLRSGTELVQVAVSVSDRGGRPIGDLSRADFTLTERGSRLDIAFFERVEAREPPPTSGLHHTTIIADVANNLVPPGHRRVVIVLDDLNTAHHRTAAVKSTIRRFVEQHLSDSDFVAVISTGGRDSAAQDFTTDRARVLRAINNFAGLKTRSTLHDVRTTMEAVASIAKGLGDSDGRRVALLFVSEGLDLDIFDVMNPQSTDVVRTIEHAVSALKATNTVLYAIDPRGLATAEGEGIETNAADADGAKALGRTAPSTADQLALSVGSLRHLAEATGGFAPRTNDYTDAFRRIMAEASSYYVLGFYPSGRGNKGEVRPLKVQVSRPGAHVSSRQGYLFHEPARQGERTNSASAALAALLRRPIPATELRMRIQPLVFRGNGGLAQLQVIVEVLGSGLTFYPLDGRFLEELELGVMSISVRNDSLNRTAANIQMRLTPSEVQRVADSGVRWIGTLDLRPGRYQLRVGALAARSRKSGSVFTDVDVPEFGKKSSISAIALTSPSADLMRTSGRMIGLGQLPTPPTAARVFPLGDAISAAATFYSSASNQLPPQQVGATIESRDNQNLARAVQSVNMITSASRDSTHLYLTFDTQLLGVGTFVLRITGRASGSTHMSAFERISEFTIVPPQPDTAKQRDYR